MHKQALVHRVKRTKIITTLGPSTHEPELIEKLFAAGMNTVRLNFSHGDYEEQGYRIKGTKQVREKLGKPISIMLDTKGPEIRVGKFKGGVQHIHAGSKITIYTDAKSFNELESTPEKMSVSYDMSKDLKPGHVILVDDGKLELNVIKVEPGVVHTTAFNSHFLKTNKRVNLPGVNFSLPFMSEKDKADILFGIKEGVDYIAASFVNSAADVKQIRKLLNDNGGKHIQIISKIESQLGLDNIDEIIVAGEGIMIARGDLGLEIPYYDVPYWEKILIRKCREAGKLVVVATQMLESMTDNPAPTRAEVNDVYFATELGADATMLSGESAAGKYPIITTETMSTINKRAEVEFYKKGYYQVQFNQAVKTTHGPRAVIAKSLAEKTRDGEYAYSIVLSRTGKLLETISKFRPNTSILGITEVKHLYTAFGIWHSIFMNKTNDFNGLSGNTEALSKIAKKWGANVGEKILIVRNEDIQELKII